MTTISTVGYGDIAPTRFRPLFACFFLVAVVLFAFLLGESIALVTELGNYRRMHALFEDGLGPEALAKMDNYQGDGRVCSSLLNGIPLNLDVDSVFLFVQCDGYRWLFTAYSNSNLNSAYYNSSV